MLPKLPHLSVLRSCACDPYKTYTPWNWTRHTASCAIYKSKFEEEQAEKLLQAKEQEENVHKAQAAAEEARRVQEEQRVQVRADREHETLEISEEDPNTGPYNLRPARIRKPPWLFPGMVPSLRPPRRLHIPVDVQPAGPGSIDVNNNPLPSVHEPPGPPSNCNPALPILPPPATYRTTPNTFGLVREYPATRNSAPPPIPEHREDPTSTSLAHMSPELSTIAELSYKERALQIIAPLRDLSVFRFAHWFYTSRNISSQAGGNELISSVICDEDFDPNAFKETTIQSINQDLDNIDLNPSTSSCMRQGDSWKSASITINLPTGKASRPGLATGSSFHVPGSAEMFGEPFLVPGFRYRSLIEVLRTRFSDPDRSKNFHYRPYKQFVTKSDGTEERVVDDLYTSDAWIKEHEKIQNLQIQDDNPELHGIERAVAAFMFGSDATTPTNFGQNSIWPLYGYFGNEPKSFRRKPDRISVLHGKAARAPLLTHCKRELFHECWKMLLDPDFIYAYHNGIVVQCGDGVTRRLFPRIFTYSADYPEKALIATIRVLGALPCPRCLVQLSNVSLLGTENDFRARETQPRTNNTFNGHLTRRLIYRDGCAVNSSSVEAILRPYSGVPTLNAFSTRLQDDPSFSVNRILVPDLMHEFELGVWKSVFMHLIRMLETLGADTVGEFNTRFRMMGTFGIDTIRKFHDDVSEMKSLAARDFEDILQCSIPCFAGLFPDHDEDIQSLLFILAEWHFLAKLRMHTESTISTLRAVTKLLGTRLRHFQNHIANTYTTHETNKEYRTRSRRKLAKNAMAPIQNLGAQLPAQATNSTTSNQKDQPGPAAATVLPRRRKQFSLQTYKIHALGDYPATIKEFGTTDSYSTQIIELEHRRVKNQYKRTNHVGAVQQMTLIERREAHLRARARALHRLKTSSSLLVEPQGRRRKIRVTDAYMLEIGSQIRWGSPTDKYHIAIRGEPIQLSAFLARHENDPAAKDFYIKLERHIAIRLGTRLSEDASTSGSSSQTLPPSAPRVIFPTLKLYEHAALRSNFTTYDVCRSHDTISPKTSHRFVILPNTESDIRHPFWYARVLGIFHIDAREATAGFRRPTQRFDFLWVRWLGESKWGGWARHRLDRISYVDDGDCNGSFDFVDPAQVIRGAYLAPAFHLGRTKAFLRQSVAWDSPEEGDWAAYYVIRFVDRDMGMRYLGGGIGHFNPVPGSLPDCTADSTEFADELGVDISAPVNSTENAGPDQPNSSDEESEGESDSASSDDDGADVLEEEGAFDI
ncbi:hypothetical protein CTheo_8081 [Ceratobasidium theobromae]|uniref:Uncharacterized protein n=1 Tax=Ceratobasidium theobromae TaxID=1582974 RepID=A0A5N5QAQ7_9AGAM|nr:hypothetical protein CTheo_8081 [Ceratobasidium theobromae]